MGPLSHSTQFQIHIYIINSNYEHLMRDFFLFYCQRVVSILCFIRNQYYTLSINWIESRSSKSGERGWEGERESIKINHDQSKTQMLHEIDLEIIIVRVVE